MSTEVDADPRDLAWRTHGRDLLRYATLLVGPADAPDVVAIAFDKAMRVSRPIEDERRYLLRAVTNTATDQARSRLRRQARELKAASLSPVLPAESDVDVRRAVAKLSVQQRAVVYFTYWEDLDSNQIAELLQIASATVRRHLARARVHLRKALS